MAEPRRRGAIPREVLEALEAQRAALAKVAPRHVSRLLAMAREIQAALEARLKALAPGRYTTQEARVVLLQMRAITDMLGAELGERMGKELEAIGRQAARIGRDGLIDQLKAWGPEFKGSLRRIAAVEDASDLLDPGLLEYYRVSQQTYGMEAIGKMRAVLARSAMEGKTIVQTWEQLAPAVDIAEWRAERIVRTEQSFALHRRQKADVEATFGAEAKELWRKQLITTFDNRTGADSISVHEQIRKFDEPFEDNEGRKYQHPPNRPNDREVMVQLPPEDPPEEAQAPEAVAEEAQAEGAGANAGAKALPRSPERARADRPVHQR